MKFLDKPGLQTLWTKIKAVFAPKENGVYYVPGTSGYANWSANTAYAVGANVVNPSGECWTCKTAHTSGSSWSSTNWNRISAVALTGTIDGVTALYAGLKIAYRFQVLGGEGSTTLNVNNLGAKTITRGTGAFYRWTIGQNGVAILVYDGSVWRFGDYDSNDQYVLPDAYCSTAAGTQAKAATSIGFNYSRHNNIPFRIYFTAANTYDGNLTLNVNSQGAKALWINGSASSSSNKTIAIGVYWCYYDGTQFQLWTDKSLWAYKYRGDGSSLTETFSAASSRANIASGESNATIFGKIAKWLGDLGTAAFKNVPASGNASSTEVVLGSDTRLSAGASAVQDVTVGGASVVNSSTKVAAVPNASTSVKGAVQLAGSIGATVASENNKAATEKAVRDALDGKEDSANKVQSLENPSQTTFPSTQAVMYALNELIADEFSYGTAYVEGIHNQNSSQATFINVGLYDYTSDTPLDFPHKEGRPDGALNGSFDSIVIDDDENWNPGALGAKEFFIFHDWNANDERYFYLDNIKSPPLSSTKPARKFRLVIVNTCNYKLTLHFGVTSSYQNSCEIDSNIAPAASSLDVVATANRITAIDVCISRLPIALGTQGILAYVRVSAPSLPLSNSTVITDYDFNDFIDTGMYRLNVMSTSSHKPGGVSGNLVLQVMNADTFVIQTLYDIEMYYRTRDGSKTWSSWYKMSRTSV